MSKANLIRAKILANYDKWGQPIKKLTAIAAEANTTAAYVHALASRMAKAGLLPVTPAEQERRSKAREKALRNLGREPEPSPEAPPTRDPLQVDSSPSLDVLDGIVKLPGNMTRDQRIARLADIARNGTDIAAIQAVTRLEEMERAAGTTYGPPPPTTREDTIILMVELLRSTNPEWVQAAIEAYNESRRAETSPIPPPEPDPQPDQNS